MKPTPRDPAQLGLKAVTERFLLLHRASIEAKHDHAAADAEHTCAIIAFPAWKIIERAQAGRSYFYAARAAMKRALEIERELVQIGTVLRAAARAGGLTHDEIDRAAAGDDGVSHILLAGELHALSTGLAQQPEPTQSLCEFQPGLVMVWRGIRCKLTGTEHALVARLHDGKPAPLRELMSPTAIGAVWNEFYTAPKRETIRKAVCRVNDKLLRNHIDLEIVIFQDEVVLSPSITPPNFGQRSDRPVGPKTRILPIERNTE